MALVIPSSTLMNLTADQRAFFDSFRTTSYYERYRIDNYGLSLDPNDPKAHWLYAYWLKQFGFSRSEEMKGILLVPVPFVVSS